MARRSKKKAVMEKPVAITVLTGEMAFIERGIDRLQARLDDMGQKDQLDEEFIDMAANRMAGASAARKRIKAINAAMDGKTLVELRRANGPMEALIIGQKIAGEEMMAIMDMERAMMAISGAGFIKPVSLELKSAGKKGEWSRMTEDSVENYRAWADFWSARKTYGDHTSEIVVRAVIHGHSFRTIAHDVSKDRETCTKIAVRGLRDYAARAGWVPRQLAVKWMGDALKSFRGRPVGELGLAVARARRLREVAA
ncbi:hypothetical protein ABIB07_001791 [Bradyrhizobium sp. RT10b]